jgi:hypothetical protein
MSSCYIKEEKDKPRSRRSPSIVTRSEAERRSCESMRQQRSISLEGINVACGGVKNGTDLNYED